MILNGEITFHSRQETINFYYKEKFYRLVEWTDICAHWVGEIFTSEGESIYKKGTGWAESTELGEEIAVLLFKQEFLSRTP